ncbi:hypothetical protein EW093_05190 [Thiospirochaeta perfilievii]|uniref:Extracellular solute-binding protein n=1 Tax=Thiospirochaeta perfilievii TaxID=252967 RepID=A0A5C1QB78_9SPIO|nr:hypothetical protein [Thiospirochaeta perfilievii]QEN04119.1 hypothetical protein EW093_05190 [Thiospirochaeta perfilievii]
MKKQLIALIALSLVSVMSFANSNKEQKGADGKTTLSIFIGESMPDYPADGTIVGDRVSELANVDYEFEFLVGELQTRTGIMLASGDYPDIINARGEQHRFLNAGALLPLNDLITTHAPNLKKMLGDQYWEALKEEDGNIYILPDLIPYGETNYTDADKGWWIQKAVLKEAGWPEVKKFEDYWKLIENYKMKHPEINGEETIGFEPLTYDWYRDYLYTAAPLLEGMYSDNPIINKINGKWRVSPLDGTDLEYKYFKFMNEQFNKGLIDPEGFVADKDQYIAKIASGRVLGIFDEYWIMNEAQEILKDENPDRIFVALPLTWDGGDDQYHYAKALATGLGTSITTSCKDPVAAIKFLDTLATDEIQKLATWGVEGVDYSIDSKGKFAKTADQVKQMDENGNWFYPVWGGKYFYEFLPSMDGTFDDGNATRFGMQPSVFKEGLRDSQKEVLDAYGLDSFYEMFTPASNERAMYSPLWSIAPVTGSDEDLVGTKIYDLRTKYCALAMTAEPGDFQNVWDEWMSQISDEDLEIQTNFYQEAINKRLAGYGVDNE